MKEASIDASFEKQDIKSQPITEDQLEEMKALSGSYDTLFSRKARKYKELGLKDQHLEESDYKRYILEEYTFLKRPVVIIEEEIFIGNSPEIVDALKSEVAKN